MNGERPRRDLSNWRLIADTGERVASGGRGAAKARQQLQLSLEAKRVRLLALNTGQELTINQVQGKPETIGQPAGTGAREGKRRARRNKGTQRRHERAAVAESRLPALR